MQHALIYNYEKLCHEGRMMPYATCTMLLCVQTCSKHTSFITMITDS